MSPIFRHHVMHAPTHSHLSDHVTLASPIPVWLTMLTTCHWSGSRPVGKNSTAYRVCMALQWGRGSASGAYSPVETWGPHSGIFSLNPFSQSCSSAQPLRFWGIFAATQLLRLLRRSLTPSGTTPWATKARYLLGGSAPPYCP